MTEADYIAVSNLAKLRIMTATLRTVVPDGEITEGQYRETLALLNLWLHGLEDRVHRMVK